MHGITVVCRHHLSCCIYTAPCFSDFCTAIPTSFNILMKCFYYTCFPGFSLQVLCVYCVLRVLLMHHMSRFRSHDKYQEMVCAINGEMVSNHTKVLINPCRSHL